jgi:hypothetical protein
MYPDSCFAGLPFGSESKNRNIYGCIALEEKNPNMV